MDSDDTRDVELVARLKRLDAGGTLVPGFDYDAMLERHAAGMARSRRRMLLARGAAVALVVALVGASFSAAAHRACGHLPCRGGTRGSHRQRR